MTTSTPWIAAAVFALASAAAADDMTTKPVSVNAKDLKWSAAPPDFAKGMKMTVLYGDPTKPALFAARLQMPDGFAIAPHWHSQDEQLTVLSGTLVLHMGDTMKADPHTLEAGGFHFLPAKMHHAAETKGETIVQLQGMGPFDIHYLNPADNPNPKAASR